MDFSIDKWKEQIPYQTALLSIFSGVAAALLVVVQIITGPVIELRLEEDQNALLKEVLNGKPFSNQVFEMGKEISYDGQVYNLYEVRDNENRLTHYVISGEEEGYSGTIRFLVGVDTVGKIEGVRVLSHTETPGLGDKIELAKSDWVLGFNKRSLANTPNWGVKKDGGEFDQFTGATITPRSVVRGLKRALNALEQEK